MVNMFGRRGQGTTEYLIILSVIIVIALVVVGVMGWFPGLGTTITEGESRAYWAAASPIALVAWDINSSHTTIVLRNLTTDTITVSAMTLGGTTLTFASTILPAGSQAAISGTGITYGGTGASFSKEVVITYSVSGGIPVAKETGGKPMVGKYS
ncbi:MAG: hypothetical protein AABW85_01385 [archaeon]